MYVKIKSFNFTETSIKEIYIEALSQPGIPTVRITGLPEAVVRESFYRVSAALKTYGINLPNKKIIINIHPATLPKNGIGIDLALTSILLKITKTIPKDSLNSHIVFGELDLEGKTKKIPGMLACLEKAKLSKEITIIPEQNIKDSIFNPNIVAIRNINDLIDYAKHKKKLELKINREIKNEKYNLDFSEILDQELAVRASLIAGTGKHNILFIGSAGIGKTMIAERIPSILAPLSKEELIEINSIYSMAQKSEEIINTRPFRAPHHTASIASVIGGKNIGEISLAHKGVLFLDEFSEYNSRLLNALREPLEKKQIHISRVKHKYILPADFILVASSNPCSCGNYLSKQKKCYCTSRELANFRKKLNGPLLDRFDIILVMDKTPIKRAKPAPSSKILREQLIKAQKLMKEKLFSFDKESLRFLKNIKDNYSYRQINKIKRLSKTISSLDNSTTIKIKHISEAEFYIKNPYEHNL